MLGFNGQWMLISPVSVYDEPLLVNPTTPFFVTLIIKLTHVNFQWLTFWNLFVDDFWNDTLNGQPCKYENLA